MRETGIFNANDQYDPVAALPYPPVWEVQGRGTVTGARAPDAASGSEGPPPWFDVRLTFADGARLDVLAVVEGGRIAIEDLRADPPLPLPGLTVLADRIGAPLAEACRTGAPGPPPAAEPGPRAPGSGHRRARPAALRGRAVRRAAADAYRAAQRSGADPVLAVMGATGRSRRKSLRLIAGARDEGLLTPRHNRRPRP
ncbi:DUF6214 family protein [Streptomyces sp. NPDC014894]|uniref:DUF6214 family protein n=1 Tax=unclassified Streptomyces TaxID=2593676 RepID=UPI0036F4BEE4